MARKFTFTTQVYDKKTDFPQTGDVDVIYIDASKNLAYRYDDSYHAISSNEVAIWGALGDLSKKGGGASWGTITGTLSNQTDLDTALRAKQNSLVSGTSIKTINGNSVLGSGDLSISGGGGLQGIHGIIPSPSLTGVSAMVTNLALITSFVSANRITVNPFIPANSFLAETLYINCITAAATNAKIVIYDDLNGKPNNLLLESSNLSLSTTGQKSFVAYFDFIAGTTYWIGVQSSASAQISHYNSGSLIPIHQLSTTFYINYWRGATFGPAPTTFGSGVANTGVTPFVGMIKI